MTIIECCLGKLMANYVFFLLPFLGPLRRTRRLDLRCVDHQPWTILDLKRKVNVVLASLHSGQAARAKVAANLLNRVNVQCVNEISARRQPNNTAAPKPSLVSATIGQDEPAM